MENFNIFIHHAGNRNCMQLDGERDETLMEEEENNEKKLHNYDLKKSISVITFYMLEFKHHA